MFVLYGVMFGLGAIAAYILPLCCNKEPKEVHDKDQSLESDSSLVYIKISQPYRNKSSNETISNTLDCKQSSIDSTEAKEMKQVAQDIGPVSSEEARIVPVKPPRNRHRVQRRIWSSALKDQLENITNSSSEIGGTTKVVEALIEGNPVSSASSEAFNPSRHGSSQSHLKSEKTRKLSIGIAKKWKSLKKTLLSSSSERSTLCKDTDTDETQRLNVPVRNSKQSSPLEYSAVLQKNRLVDASTSTRISTNASNARTKNDETVAKRGYLHNNVETASMQPQNNSLYSNNRTIQEVASLIQNQSVDGKLICDVSITGLAMNQAQFLDLFEATEGGARTASIVTTEESSIISIKFHRRRNSNGNSKISDTSFYKCPLKKFYRSLPEIFEVLPISKLFKSHEVSEKPRCATPSIRISDHSNNSRNETSYIAFPNVTKRFVADESMFDRRRTLSKRSRNSYATGFTAERGI